MPFDAFTPEIACDVLIEAGLHFTPEQLRVEAREDRWLVHLPNGRLAWFAASDEGRRRLTNERRVLRLLEERCRFAAPRVLFEDSTADFDVRAMVPGSVDYQRLLAEIRDHVELGRE